MIIRKPDYYSRFRCIAGACPDSCCQEWDVDVDAQMTSYYLALPGALGDRLRSVLQVREDGSGEMRILDGRCPMWREDGLCRIQAELGEQALCRVCREFPRLTHDYGDFVEYGLELSCPEAAKWILGDRDFCLVSGEVPGEGEAEYDEEAMRVLLRTRENALSLLRREGLSVPRALTLLLLYGYRAQEELDGGEEEAFDEAAALAMVRSLPRGGEIGLLTEFFSGLELLTDRWQRLLERAGEPVWESGLRAMAGYFVNRYWLQAVSDYDLVCRVKMTAATCILVAALPGDLADRAQLLSKEIENSADNIDALLDAAYTHPAFTDLNLLGLLREE